MVVSALDRAWQRRAAARARFAFEKTDAYRLFTGGAEGVEGLVIDIYGNVAVALEYEGQAALDDKTWDAIGAWLLSNAKVTAVYRKRLAVDRSTTLAENAMYDATPLLGSPVPARIVAREHGVAYLIEPYGGFSTGLFLDQRENRHRLAQLAAGKTVLNAFSYTCGFSVAAAKAGAQTTSVDLSKKWLDWGRQNFRANELEPEKHAFFADDFFAFVPRAAKRGQRFDLVIVDPPSFARGTKGAFSLKKDLVRLVTAAASLVAPGGHLFVSSNFSEWDSTELKHRVASVLETGREIALPAVAEDFRPQAKLACGLYQIN